VDSLMRLVLHLHVIHTNHLLPWGKLLLERLTVPQIFNKFPKFMQPKGSLPLSQQRITCPCPKQKNPVNDVPQYIFKIHSNILPPTLWSSKSSLSFMSPHNKPTCLSLLTPMCHIPHTSLLLILIT